MTKTVLKKNKEGYSYKYTDLSGIHEYLESIDARYIQKTERIGEDDYIFTKRCFSGKWEEEWLQGSRVVNAVLSGIKNPAQEQGSALTYARRYSLLMAFGLSTDDDDAQSLTMPIITNKEDAENYKLTFGKYAGKTLKEVPENYIHWLLENSKDETIKTACDYLIEHLTHKENEEAINLINEIGDIAIAKGIDFEEIKTRYNVKSSKDMTLEQLIDCREWLGDK